MTIKVHASATLRPTGQPDPGIRWMGGADLVAHAYRSRARGARPLCGALALDERYARPPQRRCMGCRALLTDLAPGEQSELWGR